MTSESNCTKSWFPNQPLRWRYKHLLSEVIPTLEVQTLALSINSLRWRYKHLLYQSTLYAGGTNRCFLNQPLRWWYILVNQVQCHATRSANQVHCHAMHSATRGAYFWQMAHTKYGKRSLRHLGPKIWDNIDPTLHNSSQLTFKNSTEMHLSLPMMTYSMVLKHGFLYVNCIQLHLTYSPLLLQIAHFPLNIFPLPIAIFIPYFS